MQKESGLSEWEAELAYGRSEMGCARGRSNGTVAEKYYQLVPRGRRFTFLGNFSYL